MSEWIEWNGGECPVDTYIPVYVKTRGPSIDGIPFEWEYSLPAGCFRWEFHDACSRHDIVAYRIVEDD